MGLYINHKWSDLVLISGGEAWGLIAWDGQGAASGATGRGGGAVRAAVRAW